MLQTVPFLAAAGLMAQFAEYIIHTVGPIYGKEGGREPAISTGVYGYPKEEAVKIVYKTIKKYLKKDNFFDEIIFVLHSLEDLHLYKLALKKLRS